MHLQAHTHTPVHAHTYAHAYNAHLHLHTHSLMGGHSHTLLTCKLTMNMYAHVHTQHRQTHTRVHTRAHIQTHTRRHTHTLTPYHYLLKRSFAKSIWMWTDEGPQVQPIREMRHQDCISEVHLFPTFFQEEGVLFL